MAAGDMDGEGQGPLYADAESKLEGADMVIVGAPFERTTCHRKGCAEGPWAIRQESYNFETYIPELDFDLERLSICDCGDIGGTDFPWFFREAWAKAWEIRLSGAFPILLGGEHSVTPMWLACLMGVDPWELGEDTQPGANTWADDFCVITVDAHLDFRDGYLGEHLSHASACRRVSELVDVDSVVPFGVRSFSSEEMDFLGERASSGSPGIRPFSMHYIRNNPDWLEKVTSCLGDQVYITLDLDALDPSVIPHTGTPEPGGLSLRQVLDLLNRVGASRRIIGCDVVELSPDRTSRASDFAAARLAMRLIALSLHPGREANLPPF